MLRISTKVSFFFFLSFSLPQFPSGPVQRPRWRVGPLRLGRLQRGVPRAGLQGASGVQAQRVLQRRGGVHSRPAGQVQPVSGQTFEGETQFHSSQTTSWDSFILWSEKTSNLPFFFCWLSERSRFIGLKSADAGHSSKSPDSRVVYWLFAEQF